MPPRLQLLRRSFVEPCKPHRQPQCAVRTLTSSAPSRKDTGSHLPKHIIPKNAPIPEYPYGRALLFKQSDRGLYGGQMIQFGNKVSPDSKTKTRRYWLPNVLNKSLYSVALDRRIKLRITSKVLKTIDREGGLDEYLLKQSEKRIEELGPIGWNLRWMLLQTPAVIARFRAEAAALGLAQDTIDKEWPITPEWRQKRAERKGELDAQLVKLVEEYAKDDEAFETETEAKRIKRVGLKYLKKGWVESHEDGIKLAIERADFRRAKREQGAKRYEKHLEEVEQAGSINAWRAARAAEIEAAGGKERWLAEKKERKKQEFLSQATPPSLTEGPAEVREAL